MHPVAFLRALFLALAIAPLIGNGNEARADFDGTYDVTYSGTLTYSGPTTLYVEENGFSFRRDEPYFVVNDVADEMTGTVKNGTIIGIPGTGTVSAAGVVNGYLQFPGGDIWEFEGTATLPETGGVEAQGTWTHYSINEFNDVVDGFGTWTATRISTDLIADTFSWNAEKSGYDLTYEVAEAPLEVETPIGLYWATGETVDSIIDIDAPAYSETIDKQVGSYDLFVALDDIEPPPKDAVGKTKATHLLMALNPRKLIDETDHSNNVRALKRGLNIDEFIKQYREIAALDGTVEVNLRKLLTFMQNDPSIQFEKDVRQAAYMLATVRAETAIYAPKYEQYNGRSAYRYFEGKYGYRTAKGRRLGNTEPGDGYLYRGRGYVQITGKINYTEFSAILGLNLLGYPYADRALEPVIAYDILSIGLFYGKFTGVSLGNYITDTSTDYLNARKVVNGLDRARLVQNYALAFEKVLKASVIGF